MLRKVVFGSGFVALVPTVKAAAPAPSGTGSNQIKKPPPMRPSELPIYEAPHAEYAEYLESKESGQNLSYIKTALQLPVRTVREQVQQVLQQTTAVTDVVRDNYHEIQDRTEWIFQYLREEENKDIRYGAVAMGGLTGFIFGLRGGIIRRLFYTGIGTTAMGFVCFPEQTREIVHSNGALARQYINIAYNFLYGVKPGDPQLEVKFPELSLPKDFSQFVDLTVSVASSIKQAIMPPPTKEVGENKPSDKKD